MPHITQRYMQCTVCEVRGSGLILIKERSLNRKQLHFRFRCESLSSPRMHVRKSYLQCASRILIRWRAGKELHAVRIYSGRMPLKGIWRTRSSVHKKAKLRYELLRYADLKLVRFSQPPHTMIQEYIYESATRQRRLLLCIRRMNTLNI